MQALNNALAMCHCEWLTLWRLDLVLAEGTLDESRYAAGSEYMLSALERLLAGTVQSIVGGECTGQVMGSKIWRES